jgi:hypothetical protein
MLRITTDENPQVLTLRLEGRLEGPWVEVLTECWSGALSGSSSRRRCVDLNGVTFIDGEGKARLTQIYTQGAEFIADDLVTKAIVAEITGSVIGTCDAPSVSHQNKTKANRDEN